MEVAEAVGRLWEVVIREMGAKSDFTSAIEPIEKAAGSWWVRRLRSRRSENADHHAAGFRSQPNGWFRRQKVQGIARTSLLRKAR